MKKQVIDVYAPKFLGNKIIAKTITTDVKNIKNRCVEVNTIDLFGDYSRFFVKLKLKVIETNGTKAKTKFVGHEVMRDRIYRMVRRRTSKIELVNYYITKDKINMKLKVIIVLPKRVLTSIKSKIRKIADEVIKKEFDKKDFEELVLDIVHGRLQNNIKHVCKKTYPILGIEIEKSNVVE